MSDDNKVTVLGTKEDRVKKELWTEYVNRLNRSKTLNKEIFSLVPELVKVVKQGLEDRKISPLTASRIFTSLLNAATRYDQHTLSVLTELQKGGLLAAPIEDSKAKALEKQEKAEVRKMAEAILIEAIRKDIKKKA